MPSRFPIICAIAALLVLGNTTLRAEMQGDEPLPTVQQIIETFFEQIGGRHAHDQLVSFRATGKILRDGRQETFTVFRKRPDRFRISQTRQNVTTILGFEGRDAWRLVTRDGEVVFSDRMPTEDLETLTLEAEFNGPLLTTVALSRDLQVVGREALDEDSEVVVLEGSIRSINRKSRLGIDGDTGRELWWELIGEEETRRTDFSDYRSIDGYPFAHRMMISTNGEVDSLIVIDRIDVNVGIFDAFFRLDFALDSSPHAADAQINR